MKIWAHTLFRNEERYLWFSVMSVIGHVDKVLLWDTGSTDKSFKIAEEIKKRYPKKVDLKQAGKVDAESFTKFRQKMLDESDCDWILIVDGDEVWWDDSIRKLISVIKKKGEKLETIITPYLNLVGDIFHYQEESAGRYKIDGKVGHLTIRAINKKIPGLHLDKPHGTQGFFDENKNLIQKRPRRKRLYLDTPYLHFTHLSRSLSRSYDLAVMKRGFKLKYELGISFPSDFFYPEVFFRLRPAIVASPWLRMDKKTYLKSAFLTPARRIKRRLSYGKVGY